MKRQRLRTCLSFRAKIKKYRAKAVCTPAQIKLFVYYIVQIFILPQ